MKISLGPTCITIYKLSIKLKELSTDQLWRIPSFWLSFPLDWLDGEASDVAHLLHAFKPYLELKGKEVSAAEDSTVGDEDKDSSSTARLFWPCSKSRSETLAYTELLFTIGPCDYEPHIKLQQSRHISMWTANGFLITGQHWMWCYWAGCVHYPPPGSGPRRLLFLLSQDWRQREEHVCI